MKKLTRGCRACWTCWGFGRELDGMRSAGASSSSHKGPPLPREEGRQEEAAHVSRCRAAQQPPPSCQLSMPPSAAQAHRLPGPLQVAIQGASEGADGRHVTVVPHRVANLQAGEQPTAATGLSKDGYSGMTSTSAFGMLPSCQTHLDRRMHRAATGAAVTPIPEALECREDG